MQKNRNKTAILLSIVLMISIAASAILAPTLGQSFQTSILPNGSRIPTYAFINVAPNPAGVGQEVTVNFFLATPLENSLQDANAGRPTNMSVIQTNPDGTTKSLGNGNFTGDLTGGTFTIITPEQVGNYTFQFFYGGQVIYPARDVANAPSVSKKVTLVVQEEPIPASSYPITPLPNAWWETPVTAENVQEWYKITGPWLGLGSIVFGATGMYNQTSFCNPYTPSVLSGHILWTKVWQGGGITGGDSGGTESSHYWSTSQYQPKYAPVIINGIMYSTHYTATTSYSNGIDAINLYTGETLWTINTTNALRCGMVTMYNHINQYGGLGPFIWTTGTLPAADTGGTRINQQSGTTQWNMYDAFTGKYVASVVNGSSLTLRPDENGNLIGYFINNTAGVEYVHPIPGQNVMVTHDGPHLTCVNMTMALGQTGGSWSLSANTVREMKTGYMWSVDLPTNISGAAINPALAINAIVGDTVMLSGGYVQGQGFGGETAGWMVFATFDVDTGKQYFCNNYTYADGWGSFLPFTRTSTVWGEGLIINENDVNYVVDAIDAKSGKKVWTTTLKADGGADPNDYDLFSLKPYVANGKLLTAGLGGDLWCHDMTDGKLQWYTNTTKLLGDPGTETPYGIWPLWVFTCAGQTNDVAYFPIGHEYNPPLFHGAQMLAINMTDGSLIWSELGTYIRSTAIAYGVMLSQNAYDNQIYAFGKGPSQMTVSAPQVGVSTGTPITITGRLTDIAEGSKRHDVAANFPNGVPCVSDESQSKWMEHVYQQQPRPYDVTGVDVTINVVDGNGNFRTIGNAKTVDGSFAFVWQPDISGSFQVIASFEGSNSYYPSSASTYFYASDVVDSVPPADMRGDLATTGDLLTYLAAGVIAIIVAIALIGLLILRKK